MNIGLPSLLDAIFGKNDLSSVSLEEVYDVINEFPSFNAAHFILSKKLKELGDPAYEKESLRTALYFNNPFWLKSVLENNTSAQKEFQPEAHRDQKLAIIYEQINAEPEKTESVLPQRTEPESGPVTSFDELVLKYSTPTDDSENGQTEFIPEKQEEIGVTETAVREHQVNPAEPEFSEEVINEYGIFEEVRTKKTGNDRQEFEQDWEIPEHPEEISIPESTPSVNSNESIIEQPPVISEPPEFETQVEAIHVSDEPVEEILEIPLPEPEPNNAENPVINETEDEELEYNDPVEEAGSDEMEAMSARFREQKEALAAFDPKKAESIVFAPYHMIDYFASQGIKLVLDENPPDAFGRQLKSFTDWLKVMKKLPTAVSTAKNDESESEKIKGFADHSIEERDVLTESMAEVLAKQGMFENAIALYQKLSLIYPPKSAYFASRIEQLKASLS